MMKAVTRRERVLAVATLTVIFGVVILTCIIEPQLKKRRTRLALLHDSQTAADEDANRSAREEPDR